MVESTDSPKVHLECRDIIRFNRISKERDRDHYRREARKATRDADRQAFLEASACAAEQAAALLRMERAIDPHGNPGWHIACQAELESEQGQMRIRLANAMAQNLPETHPYLECLKSYVTKLRAIELAIVDVA